MAAQDAASKAAADVAGTVGEAGGLVTTVMNWLTTEGPGMAVKLASALAIIIIGFWIAGMITCLLYTSPSPRDQRGSRMPSSA